MVFGLEADVEDAVAALMRSTVRRDKRGRPCSDRTQDAHLEVGSGISHEGWNEGPQADQQRSQGGGRDGMPRRNIFQEDRAGAGAATTSALVAIRAVDPLAPDLSFVGLGRVIAVK